MRLSNEQWSILAPLFLPKPRLHKRGGKRRDSKEALEGILWILTTGAQWKHLPKEYPPYQTCHRWFQRWIIEGKIAQTLTHLARDMELRGKIKVKECFLDGTFSSAKKGALELDLQNAGKARKSWRFRTKTLFQSPSARCLLLLMKSPWWKKRLPPDLRERIRVSSLLTRRMIPIRLMRNSGEEESD